MTRTTRWLTVGLMGVLIAGCDPGEDNSGPSLDGGAGGDGGGGGDLTTPDFGTDGGGNDVGSDGGDPANGIACHLEIAQDEACLTCSIDQCEDELIAAFGVAGLPTEPGGACAGLLGCINACDCEDDNCAGLCFANVNAGCQAALEDGQVCQTEQCADSCSDQPTPTDDVCTQAIGGLGPNTTADGDLSETDRTGTPRQTFFDTYTLTTAGTDQVNILVYVNSNDFDSYLYVYDEDCIAVGQDDDGGGGTNSQVTVPGGPSYFVVVASFGGGEVGSYTVGATAVP